MNYSEGDIDGNGIVDASDASTILAYYAQIQEGGSMTANEYQEKAHSFADYPKKIEWLYPALEVSEEAGEVAGKFAKLIRDKNGEVTEETKKEIAKELGDVLWGIAELSTILGYSLEEVMEMNIQKLESRKSRNVIHGNGDNR